MAADNRLDVIRLSSTVRFVEGYRYLDRSGEALVRLENTADEGWIPGEVAPSRGYLNNWRLGMRAQFDSESVTVHQTEYISFEHFQDQTCKIYEILWKTFEVERILGPTFQAILQIGFDELADASAHTLKMGVCEPEKTILDVLEGQPSTVAYTLCTETDAISDGNPVVRRRRLDFRSVRQERQPDFDERVIRRLPLLPVGQQKALGHLMQLRRRYPKMHPAAVQFDLETALEGELLTRTFDLSRFFNDSWEWIGNVRKRLQGLPGRRVKGER